MADAFYRRDEFVYAARGLVDTPFRHQGRTRQGVDCWGLLVLAARTAQPNIDKLLAELAVAEGREPKDDLMEYGLLPLANLVKQAFEYVGVQKSVKEMLPGDLLLFHIGGSPTYAAIASEFGGARYVISAFSKARRVTERALSGSLERRLHAVYEPRGII